MIRIEAIRDYIADNSKIPKKDMSVHTSNHRQISRRNNGTTIELDRKYDGSIYVLNAHKWRDFTTIGMLVDDWRLQNGNEGESIDISSDETIDDNTSLISIDLKIVEYINLVPLGGEVTEDFDRQVPYMDAIYKIEERAKLTGI